MSQQSHIALSQDSVRLKSRLRAELRRVRLRVAGHAALMLLGGLGLLLGASVLAAPGWMSLGPAGAWIIWAVAMALSAWLVLFEIALPLRRLANLRGFSRELERHGHYGNLLEAATQFTSPRKDDPLKRGASAELVEEILRRACREAERTALAPRIPLVGVGLHLSLAVAALLLWMGLGLGSSSRIEMTFAALGAPARLAEPRPTTGIFSLTGNQRVLVGQDVELRARDFIGGDETVQVEINLTGDFWQEMPTRLLTVEPGRAASLEHAALVPRVEDPFRYRFRKGELRSAVHEVSIKERPVLRELAARLEPPAYTGEPASEREDLGGTVAVLEGTRVTLRGRASVALQAAQRLAEDEEPIDLPVEGDAFTDSLVVDREMSFRIGLVDDEGFAGEALTVYRFVPIADDPPTVEITAPGEDRDLERDLMLGIAAIAADDVGLERVDLLYRSAMEAEWSRVPLVRAGAIVNEHTGILDLEIERGERELALGFRWNLGEESLFPGDGLSYCIEAIDNNALEGGQAGRSAIYRLRLPTVAEVFELEREGRDDRLDTLGEIRERGEDLRETFERLHRELKKNPEPDWTKQQEILEALKSQEQLQSDVDQAAGQLQEMLDEFQRNNSGSLETLEKMETIQELVDGLQDENLQEYLEAMREALDQLSPQEVQRSMEDALATQEEYNRRLDRTIELLRQLERERVMGDLMEELSEYLSRQQELREKTAESEDGESHDEDPQLAQNDEASEDSESSEEGEPSEDAQDGEKGQEAQSEEEGAASESDDPSESGEDSESTDEGEASESDDESQSGEASESSEEGQEQSPQEGEQSGSDAESQERDPSALDDEELARAQEQLAEETKALEERLREALEELKQEMESGEADDAAAKEMMESLKQAMEQMQQQGSPSESMQDAQQQLSEGDRQEASQEQQEAMRRLAFLYQRVADGMQGMTQATTEHAVEKLQQTAYDLLNLSHEEEKIVDMLEGGVKDQRLQPITRKQARLLRGAQRLSDGLNELALKNFMIAESLLESMRELVEALEGTTQQMELTRPRRAREDASPSMGLMNRMVIGLLTAAQSQGQGGGGGGGASQQLQQLSGDQSRLNSMTQELRQKLQGGLTPAERRQLAEMRAMQEAIREQLKEIQRNMEQGEQVLGDLDKIGEDMERVTEQLDKGRVAGETRDLQEKILSRLLDAQRSVRQRDFAKRRESQEGEELFGDQHGSQLADGREDRERQVRRWLAPEMAPHAYQDDVRRYFRRIQGELDKRGKRP